MLIIKVFVNREQIDEIAIQNVGNGLKDNDQLTPYKIRKPEINDLIIKHQRSKGWMPLVHKVLEHLIKRG